MPGPPGGTGGRDDEDDAEGNGQRTPNIAPSNKQPKTCGVFTCPFRKRNPLRFNVRSHLSCATRTFPDFTQLK